MESRNSLILDGTKIALYAQRIRDWRRGKRVAPITVDMALTRACQFNCVYCYSKLQENTREPITKQVIRDTMEDFGKIGVLGVSLVSDGESTISPHLSYAIDCAKENKLAIALGTNGELLTEELLLDILPKLSYLRFNISAGDKDRYNEIMNPPSVDSYNKVIHNIKYAVQIKQAFRLPTTIGMQMVLMPEFKDQIIPLSKLAVSLGVDYLIIKHCSDDENSSLGVDYKKYKELEKELVKAENLSTDSTRIIIKWSKLADGNIRDYTQCYGPQFHIQLSGSGLVAPCGMLFSDKYSHYHIGNITKTRFIDIFNSDKYWSVMNELGSPCFNAQNMCGCLCLQHNTNKVLNRYVITGKFPKWHGPEPMHKEFL